MPDTVASTALLADHIPTGWIVGYVAVIIVVIAVVALVVPILFLAHSIGNEAQQIDDALAEAVENTAGLAGLSTTVESAGVIVAGLERGRHRLGG